MNAPLGDERPLILIHGMASSAQAWAPVVPLLSPTRTVVVVNLPGHRDGPALGNPRHLRSSLYVDAVEAEMDRLGIECADIVGNSLGGWVALQLAGRGRASSVVCLAPAGGWRVGGLFDRWITTQFRLAYRFASWLVSGDRPDVGRRRASRLLLLGMVAKPALVSAAQLEDIVRGIAECDALRWSIKRSAGRDLRTVPPADCPVLIAWSQHDRVLLSRRARHRLEAQVGTPRVIQLNGVGHVPMSDEPGLVAETILGFTRVVGQGWPEGSCLERDTSDGSGDSRHTA